MSETIYYDQLQYDNYSFLVAVSHKGLVYVDILGDTLDNVQAYFAKYGEEVTFSRDQSVTAPYLTELKEYLAGKRKTFEQPVDFGKRGTVFQQAVWQELLKVPFGESSTYSVLGERIGKPQATRAIGTAVGKNPIPIIVPCHRILRKDGGIGGYAGGLPLKYSLLAIEGIPCK